MLNKTERLQLIRQVEKSNLTDEQSDELIKWSEKMMSQRQNAEEIIVACDILEMVFHGEMNIIDFKDGEPICNLTMLDTLHPITPKEIAEYADDECVGDEEWADEEWDEDDEENG